MNPGAPPRTELHPSPRNSNACSTSFMASTRQQITTAIRAYRREHGHPPNIRELAAAMGLAASTVQRHVAALPGVKAALRTRKDPA